MAPPSNQTHPLDLPASASSQGDRRFPFAGGGGRTINPDDPQKKYRIPYCFHGWRAQARKATFGNIRENIWGCPGYVWGGRGDGDGFHCGYKESGDVDPRYGVTSVQHVNPVWDGISWWLPEPEGAFFRQRQAALSRANFLATRSPSVSPTKRSTGASSPSKGSPSLPDQYSYPKRPSTPPSPSPSPKKAKGAR